MGDAPEPRRGCRSSGSSTYRGYSEPSPLEGRRQLEDTPRSSAPSRGVLPHPPQLVLDAEGWVVPPQPLYDENGREYPAHIAREIYWMVLPMADVERARQQWAEREVPEPPLAGTGAAGMPPEIAPGRRSRSPSRNRGGAPAHESRASSASGVQPTTEHCYRA